MWQHQLSQSCSTAITRGLRKRCCNVLASQQCLKRCQTRWRSHADTAASNGTMQDFARQPGQPTEREVVLWHRLLSGYVT